MLGVVEPMPKPNALAGYDTLFQIGTIGPASWLIFTLETPRLKMDAE
jgi:hypothetical protein